MADSVGGGMAHHPERLRGGTWPRLCGRAGAWGGHRAWAAAPFAYDSGPAGSGGGYGMGTRNLDLAGTLDMGTGTLGLPAPSLHSLGAGALVA